MKFRKTIQLVGKNKKENEFSLLGPILVIVMGIVFLTIILFMSSKEESFMETAVETTAVIERIDVDRYGSGSSSRRDYDVYVVYNVDGESYRSCLNYYKTGMHEGQQVTVHYNPSDPSEIMGGNSPVGLFKVVFSAMIAFGFAVMIHTLVRQGSRNNLIKNGTKTEGIITSVYVDRNVKYNNRHPYKADCEVTDPVTGEVYLYSSNRVMHNIKRLEGRPVEVYYYPDNRKKYYVDLDSAEADKSGKIVNDFR